MIKVLHLITALGMGGAESNLARLVCNMDSARFANTVVCLNGNFDQILVEKLRQSGVALASVGMHPGIPNPLALIRLFRIIRQINPHVLQTWMYHADLVGLLIGKLASVPAIAWNIRCSQMEMRNYRRTSAMVIRALVHMSRMPDAVVANSQAGIRSHIALGYRPRKWLWLPNSLDLEQFHPDPQAYVWLREQLGVASDSTLIGLVARYDPMKDHKNFINAARIISSVDEEVNFVLVGRGLEWTNSAVAALIKATGVRQRFHLLGLRKDINRITAGFDIACSASAYGEGSSNAVAEAMASGVPCVVTDVGDSALLVGGTGKVVPIGNPEAFALACCELLASKRESRVQLGHSARRRMHDTFSLTRVVEQYQTLYEDLAFHFLPNIPRGFRRRNLGSIHLGGSHSTR
jgi:glycosyltransferase involved in cell wall biosynthesis